MKYRAVFPVTFFLIDFFFASLVCFRMETSKNKRDVSHIEPDNDKTLRRGVLCPGIY